MTQHLNSALASQGCRVCFPKSHTILMNSNMENIGKHGIAHQLFWPSAHPEVSFLAKPMWHKHCWTQNHARWVYLTTGLNMREVTDWHVRKLLNLCNMYVVKTSSDSLAKHVNLSFHHWQCGTTGKPLSNIIIHHVQLFLALPPVMMLTSQLIANCPSIAVLGKIFRIIIL